MTQDHLFISYAWANAAFADWLAMRLTAEGYKVWVDRHKVQGGQNWVNEIDNAIKTQSIRLLGVVSSSSLVRAAPQGEWQLAMSLSNHHPNFFMPLLLEPLASTQLPFNLQVTQYTPFHEGWGAGLRQLLKYLEEQNVPKDQQAGFREISHRRDLRNPVRPKHEVLWSNELSVTKYPRLIHLYEVPRETLPIGWVMQQYGENQYWSFEEPPDCKQFRRVRTMDWRHEQVSNELKPHNVFKALAHKHLTAHCLAMGLTRSRNEEYLYVPLDLLHANKVRFITYNGSRVTKQLAGTRSKKKFDGTRQITNYHLAPVLKVHIPHKLDPVMVMNLRIYLSDAEGNALPSKQMTPRRKMVCRSWFNHEWLSLQLAVRDFLFGETAGESDSLKGFQVGKFARYRTLVGLDDAKIKARAEDEEWFDEEEAEAGH